jgi:N-hydroxyarylamine O-acetyltransferase
MNIEHYLARIGLDRRPAATLDGLRTLHRAHLLSISYENIDVQLQRPVTIERKPIYEKIVERRRGGWCYEMNGLFGWALEALGFDVTRATGAVMREAVGKPSEGNHLVLRVSLEEGVYLADVGFGDGPLDPICITPGTFQSAGFDFELSRIDHEWWRLKSHPRGGAKSFDFNLNRADESLLAEKCAQLQSSPVSPFVQNLVAQRHTPAGLLILRGKVLRQVAPDAVHEQTLTSPDELAAVFRDRFDLKVPEVAALWPKICARHDEAISQQQPAAQRDRQSGASTA